MKVVNLTKKKELAHTVIMACSLFERMKGLLGRDKLMQGESLWIKPCNSIHTIGMKFPIDVLFLDKRNAVLKVMDKLPTNRITCIYFHSSSVLELPAGVLMETDTQIGDRISIV